jgi:hypothetical protein
MKTRPLLPRHSASAREIHGRCEIRCKPCILLRHMESKCVIRPCTLPAIGIREAENETSITHGDRLFRYIILYEEMPADLRSSLLKSPHMWRPRL